MTREEVDELSKLADKLHAANSKYARSTVNFLVEEAFEAEVEIDSLTKKIQNFLLYSDALDTFKTLAFGGKFINKQNLTDFLEKDGSLNFNNLNHLIETVIKICDTKGIFIQNIGVTRESGSGLVSKVSLSYEY